MKARFFLRLFLLGLLLFVGLPATMVNPAHGGRDIHERDYAVHNYQEFHGSTPIHGRRYTVSREQQGTPSSMTFSMKDDRSLLVRFEGLKNPAGVLVMASVKASPRQFGAIWALDDIRYPQMFRSLDFWTPASACDSTGCPKIRIMATRGTVAFTIVDIMPKLGK